MATGFIGAKAQPQNRKEGPSSESPIFSSRLIRAMAAVCLVALVITAFGRLTGIGVQKLPVAEAVSFRDIRVLDTGAGTVLIEDATNGAAILRLGQGEGGFIRTVMRGLAHERMARGGGSAEPFRVTLKADNRLTITDSVTLREIILDSFGGPNRDAFARLLPEGVQGKLKAAGAAVTKGGIQ